MTVGAVAARHLPWTAQVGGEPVTFRLMTPDDRDRVLAFVKSLPEEDLYYLINDIRNPAGMNRWIEGIVDRSMITILAISPRDELLGYATLRSGQLRWTRHLGEIRIMVSPKARGRGVGKLLGKEVFAAAHDTDMRRIFARVTSKQMPARYLFQHLGFHIEALLAECVIDNEGRTQDMMFMSYDVAGFHG